MERVPTDLRTILAAFPKAKVSWSALTPIARRDFITWVTSAKQPETRKRRAERIPSMLASGKRRPCCYAVVPMNLYKALTDLPKAKTQWKTLTPTERRDFVRWIDGATDKKTHASRIEKTCVMLLRGKRRP